MSQIERGSEAAALPALGDNLPGDGRAHTVGLNLFMTLPTLQTLAGIYL